MSKRGETWKDSEALCLVAIKKKLCAPHKNTEIYCTISNETKAKGYDRDAHQCRTEIKHLKQM